MIGRERGPDKEHGVDAPKHTAETRRITQISPYDLGAIGQTSRAGIPRECPHVLSPIEQPCHDMTSDVPGRSGNENHAPSFPSRVVAAQPATSTLVEVN